MLNYEESRVYGEGPVGELAAVVIGFEADFVEIADKPGEYAPREKVIVGRRGDGQYRVEYWIDRLINPRHCDEPRLWNELIKPRYEAWRAGELIVGDGTPLTALPFVHKRQAEAWRMLHIYTAEDLAKTEDSDLPRLGMDARKARDMARTFLETKNSGMTQMAAELDRLRSRDAQRDAEMAEMRAMLDQATKPKKAA